jgi:hypothetical protein
VPSDDQNGGSMYANSASGVHVLAAASNSHNFVGVPFELSEYENAAYCPSGDQLKAWIVKLNAKGTFTICNGRQLTESKTQMPETFASWMEVPACRGCRKKYNSPASSGVEPDSASAGMGVAETACPDAGSTVRIAGPGWELKYEAGVASVPEQAVRKINVKNKKRFIQKSPFQKRRLHITKIPVAFRQREHLSIYDYGAGVIGVLVALGTGVVGVGVKVAVAVAVDVAVAVATVAVAVAGSGVLVGIGVALATTPEEAL